jgi:hypothetical protein
VELAVNTMQLIAICIYACRYPGCEHVQQEYTLPQATARLSRWTQEELEFVLGTMDEPIAEVALALGRTYYGTAQKRSKLKRGILKT